MCQIKKRYVYRMTATFFGKKEKCDLNFNSVLNAR